MIEQTRYMFCAVCGDWKEHHYIGTQKDENDEPILDLYNCKECQNTEAIRHRPNKLEDLSVSEFKRR